MPVGGYDPEDLDDTLSALMQKQRRDPSNWLSDEELAEWEDGTSLVDLLDEDQIHELLRKEDVAGDGEPAGNEQDGESASDEGDGSEGEESGKSVT